MALLTGCKSYSPVSTNRPFICIPGFATPTCVSDTKVTTYWASGSSKASAIKARNEAIAAWIEGWRKECAIAVSTPELNSIRSKVEIIHEPTTPIPLKYASLDAFPTNADISLITKWNELRAACIKQEHSINLTSPDMTPFEQSNALRRAAFFGVAEAEVNQLTIALPLQKLTYGEFAQRRYQINAAAVDAAWRYSATLTIPDKSLQFLARRRVKQQFSDKMDAWDSYMRSVDARPPRTVRLSNVPSSCIKTSITCPVH